MTGAYYNEIDPFCAQWLRNLIAAGHIAAGDVDERSIEDVKPDDLRSYRQCHFFAGIGVWSYAMRSAGWGDSRPAWTGSCPCQPFSTAGAGGGFNDARHLWPAWYWLIQQRRPETVFGEQVAGKAGLAWFDYVAIDFERADYAIGAHVICASSVGLPRRRRIYFAADANGDSKRYGAVNAEVAGLQAAAGMATEERSHLRELCTDGYGTAHDMGRLRAYGNALAAPATRLFVNAYKDCMP